MNLRSYYEYLLQEVISQTGIDKDHLMSCNRTECVDARSILICLLLRKDLTEHEVSRLTGLSQQGINRMKNSFRQRMKRWTVRNDWEALIKRITQKENDLVEYNNLT